MPTKAHYFPDLVSKPSTNDSLTLIFDYLGNINFYSLHLPVNINLGLTNYEKQLISTTDVTNACILYSIIEKMKSEVKTNDYFRLDELKGILVTRMNFAIDNKAEVAEEILTSWQRLSKFIANTSTLESKININTILDFPKQIDNIIRALLNEQLAKIKLVKSTNKASQKQVNDLGLIQLCLTLECITRNMAGVPFCFKLDVKNLLFKLARQINAYLSRNDSSKLKSYFLPIQEKINKEIIALNGNWLTSVIDFLDYELQISETKDDEIGLLDDEIGLLEELANTLNNLLQNEFSSLPENKQTNELLYYIIPILRLEKKTINSFLTRDNDKVTPKILQQAVHYALCKAALSNDIQLNPSAILRFKSTYNYDYFQFILSHLTKAVKIDKNHSDIFANILAQMAKLTQFPTFCNIYEEAISSTYLAHPSKALLLESDLDAKNNLSLVNYLNKQYGTETASVLNGEHNKIKIDLKTLIEKILPDWYGCLITTLTTKPRLKEAYQAGQTYQYISAEQLLILFQEQYTTQRKQLNCSLVTKALLKSFSIDEKLTEAYLIEDNNNIEAIYNVTLYIEGLSTNAAKQLIEKINKLFPHAYANLQTNNIGNEQSLSQQISIDKSVFLDGKFKEFIGNTINQPIQNRESLIGHSPNILFNVGQARAREQFNHVPDQQTCCNII
ncbi:hypothetical protein ACNVED_03020 [Legionella sp. D16C41]|uniref:hypothetical protein n=1 Tax=Legionella sp. D16C41 TaxID=3402688 RepID=UPI003AF990E9